MAFRFSVPSPAAGGSVTTETNLKSAKLWLDSLPLAPALPAAQQLQTTLYALNRSRLASAERFKLMELYRPTLLRVIDDLAEDYKNATVPLSERAREAVKISRELLMENAYGYKLVLMDKSDRLFTGKRQLALLMHRTVSTLSESLTLSYKTYLPTPAGVWHEIHQIYHYAQHFSLEDVVLETGRRAKFSSVSLVYKQALLLSAADPYRLGAGEAEQILALVQRFNNTVLIIPYSAELNGAGLFLVRSDTDKPPKPLATGDPKEVTPVDKVLSAASLTYSLGENAARLEAGMSTSEVGVPLYVPASQLASLCRRLEKFWSVPPKRVFARNAVNANVQVAIGFRALWKTLSQDLPSEPMVSGESLDFMHSAEADNTPLISTWDIVNQSAGGVALKRDAGGALTPVAVGVAVGVSAQANGPDTGASAWAIGAVRWVHGEEGAHIQLGVQFLAPHGDAVAIKARSGANLSRQSALLLPQIPLLRRGATLLVRRGNYNDGAEFDVTKGEEKFRARATKLIEQAQHFELFEFTMVGGPAKD